MMKLNAADVATYQRRAVSLANRARSALAKADSVLDKGITAGVTGLTAFGLGVAKGYQGGGIELVGIPVDAWVAVGAHALGFFGVAGSKSDYFNAMGNGALASWATDMGRGVGITWKRKRAEAGLPGGSTASLPAAASGASISDEDLIAMARGAAAA